MYHAFIIGSLSKIFPSRISAEFVKSIPNLQNKGSEYMNKVDEDRKERICMLCILSTYFDLFFELKFDFFGVLAKIFILSSGLMWK